MNLQSKFGNCIITQTLNIALCKRDGITDKQTEGQTDGQTDGRTDYPITRCPRRTFQAGGIKIIDNCRKLMILEIDLSSSLDESHIQQKMYKISAQYVKACRRKVPKTVYFQYSKFIKGQSSYKNCQILLTLKLLLVFIKWKSYKKFQRKMSKHVGEKCGKLCISSILISKRGITPTQIEDTQT